MSPVLVASLILIPLAIFDWIVVITLWRGYRKRASRPLRDRVRLATAIALGATVYTALVANGVLRLGLHAYIVGFAIILAAALPSSANLLWLIDLVQGRFEEEQHDRLGHQMDRLEGKADSAVQTALDTNRKATEIHQRVVDGDSE